ncbi:MAG: peptide chain release factor N(5)-glutamine methyltransferase [Gammaproteobacteria bacterium]|nr:peptide chain release factor N(5)-glutamine methyltransferase [Gammaproteobacteria bacterium]MBU1624842.1 peptide chain release factor N(5)-glutamine methyltransferase [Gammaproteobacteria bacterium]MBU1982686.1 peptide chain release factor N(5)-glutamine methyltransferase [Gammaproteobacteria bacterium]
MPSIRERLAQDVAALRQALDLQQDEARSEVQTLLQTVLLVNRAYLLAHPERLLTEQEHSQYQTSLQRRLQGEPLAYILSEREFFGLNFKVTPATLIPRPDTELLVELALSRISSAGTRVLDLGTGSGAIALAIAHSRPDAKVTAVDASEAALSVAQENAGCLEISNVRFALSNWFAALAGLHFDLIVSNPPYIAANDRHLAQGDLRFEPVGALASGTDGLDDIRLIISEAGAHLVAGGWLMVEHGYDQSERVQTLLRSAGFENVRSDNDLAGIARVTGGQLLGKT